MIEYNDQMCIHAFLKTHMQCAKAQGVAAVKAAAETGFKATAAATTEADKVSATC